jgi:phosphoribosylamine--glycine ligase
MKIMVIGGGGREHALVRALVRSPRSSELICTPGNAGIAEDARCLEIGVSDLDGIVAAAADENAELVLVGPEAPLVAGLVDALEEASVPAFGPSGAAAQIESSKIHAKELMAEAGISTASHVVLKTHEEAITHIAAASYPAVLKADGLAAGKGVIIAASEAEAREAAEVFFVEQRFGSMEVVLEEHLEGEELSLMALCDGENALALAPVQDYKRIGDGDAGPNTGGMGSYSPVPAIDSKLAEEIVDSVHRPVMRVMRERGTPFRGVLYAGLMMTAAGPKVLEFNCRFGDPETQAVMPRLRSDLVELCLASRQTGGLAEVDVEFSDDWAVSVVLASAGYPASSSKGDVISGLDDANGEGIEVTHAATARQDGDWVTAGGRVLNVTGLGPTPGAARDRAYDAAQRIRFDGAQMRSDIAARAVERVGAD